MTASNEDNDGSKKPDQSQSSEALPGEEKKASRIDRLLETRIGRVVGGVEAAKRFNALLAKTLKITE